MKKNDIVELNIQSMTAEGSGVGRVDGFAVFVPRTAVGDRVRAHIIKVTKSYAVGKLVELLDSSPDRVESDCPVFDKCGAVPRRKVGKRGADRLFRTTQPPHYRVPQLQVAAARIRGRARGI